MVGEPSNQNDPLKLRSPCPVCRQPADERYRPFCSKRCADIDLHRWFSGSYAVPVVEDDTSPDPDDGEGGER